VDKLPPQNLEAEQAVLGAIMLNPESLLTVMDHMGTEDFYRDSHRRIFNACRDQYDLGEPLDLVSLTDRLESKDDLETVGGVSYLASLASNTPTSANVKYHARLVKEKAIYRRVLQWGTELIQKAYDEAESPTALFGQMERDVIELAQGIREGKSPLINSIIAEIHDVWDKVKAGDRTHIKTEEAYEDIVPGFYPGHLWVLKGYTSFGKSSLMNQWIVDLFEEDPDSSALVFSLEDSRREKVNMLIGNIADVPKSLLIQGKIKGFEGAIDRAESTIRHWNIKIYDDVRHVDEIRLKAKKQKLQDGLDIIFIDYIQKVRGEGNTRYERVVDVVEKLDNLKIELNITIVALAQITQGSLKGDAGINAKGAGEITEAADIVGNLIRPKGSKDERWINCHIEKNRPFGRIGIIPLEFSKKWTSIYRRGVG
jgi:replicative DNA helicase